MTSMTSVAIRDIAKEMIGHIPADIQWRKGSSKKSILHRNDMEQLLYITLLQSCGTLTSDPKLNEMAESLMDTFLHNMETLTVPKKVGRPRKVSTNTICRIGECNSPSETKGLCMKHYSQQRRGTIRPDIAHNDADKCQVHGCQTVSLSKNLCSRHYDQIRNKPHLREEILKGQPIGRKAKEPKICSIEGCSEKHKALSYCSTHYVQYKKKESLTK